MRSFKGHARHRLNVQFEIPYSVKRNFSKLPSHIQADVGKGNGYISHDWDRYLPAVLFTYREVPQKST